MKQENVSTGVGTSIVFLLVQIGLAVLMAVISISYLTSIAATQSTVFESFHSRNGMPNGMEDTSTSLHTVSDYTRVFQGVLPYETRMIGVIPPGSVISVVAINGEWALLQSPREPNGRTWISTRHIEPHSDVGPLTRMR